MCGYSPSFVHFQLTVFPKLVNGPPSPSVECLHRVPELPPYADIVPVYPSLLQTEMASTLPVVIFEYHPLPQETVPRGRP